MLLKQSPQSSRNVINAALCVCVVIVCAKIGADLLVGSAVTPAVTPLSKTASADTKPARQDLSFYAAITEKGLFGSGTREPLKPLSSSRPIPGAPALPMAPNDFYLVGTAVGDGQAGLAVIGKTSTQEERTFRRGQNVFGAGVLVRVRRDRVELRNGTQIVKILAPMATMVPAPISQEQTRPPSSSGSGTVLDRRIVDAALANFSKTSTEARLFPEMRDGRNVGFRVAEIKPAGFFGMLGLRNGDVLLRLNDYPIDAPEKVMQVLSALKGQNHLSLDVLRNQQPLNLKFEVR